MVAAILPLFPSSPVVPPPVHRGSTRGGHALPVHEFQVATVLALAAGSFVAAVVTWNRTGPERRFAAFLAICAGGLAIDKATGAVNRFHAALHRIGIGDPPFLRGIDDLVLLCAMLIALAVCACHWRLLRTSPRMTVALAGGSVFAAIGFVIDSFGPEHGFAARVEDWAELAMACSLLAAIVLFRKQKPAGPVPGRRHTYDAEALARHGS